MFCMSKSTYLGSPQKFEGAAGAFKGDFAGNVLNDISSSGVNFTFACKT